jgi:ATPase subunit of ABC transporter with duplicated ATPase domains
MISFSNINKQYGKQLLFVDAFFQLNPGEKVGLVGPNGSGKTTLFRMVVGEETPDDGVVSVPRKMTIGYFCQTGRLPNFLSAESGERPVRKLGRNRARDSIRVLRNRRTSVHCKCDKSSDISHSATGFN